MNAHFHRVDAGLGRFYDAMGTLAGLSIGLIAIAIVSDLMLRLAALGNLPGMQEIVEYTLFAGVFLTAPWLLRKGAHVRVDLLMQGLPRTGAIVLERAVDVLGFLICCVMVRYSIINLSSAYAFGAEQRKYFSVPEWWLLSVIVFSFALLAIEFLIRFWRAGLDGEISETSDKGL